jgi:hypothetical protein
MGRGPAALVVVSHYALIAATSTGIILTGNSNPAAACRARAKLGQFELEFSNYDPVI